MFLVRSRRAVLAVRIMLPKVGMSAQHGMAVSAPSMSDAAKHAAVHGQPGHAVVLGPMKTRDRSEKKVKGEMDGNWGGLTDISRHTIVAAHHGHLPGLVDTARQHMEAAGFKLSHVKHQTTDTGYRGTLTNWQHPNGHHMELQFMDKNMAAAKGSGHAHYEVTREIESKYPGHQLKNLVGAAARKAASGKAAAVAPEDAATYRHHFRAQQQIYSAAHESTLHTHPDSVMMRKGVKGVRSYGNPTYGGAKKMSDPFNFDKKKYYDFDDIPATREHGGAMPVLHHADGTHQEIPLSRFYQKAQEVTPEKYAQVVADHKAWHERHGTKK